jgi:hypothetical protein
MVDRRDSALVDPAMPRYLWHDLIQRPGQVAAQIRAALPPPLLPSSRRTRPCLSHQ